MPLPGIFKIKNLNTVVAKEMNVFLGLLLENLVEMIFIPSPFFILKENKIK